MIKNKAPFPYMGSKQRVAGDVWSALGNVTRYVEPFAGSLAVLLNRPHRGKSEIVNDADGLICNFWRACQHDPEGIAALLDGAICELDLHARTDDLNARRAAFVESLRADPRWYDVEAAAWWVWCMCLHIGCGFFKVGKSIPAVRTAGESLQGILHPERQPASAYLRGISERLERVMILCGDWSRCLTPTIVTGGSNNAIGVFLDPPYCADFTAGGHRYAEGAGVSDDVRAWCIERGRDPWMRIVLCGMGDEHAELEAHGWRVQSWDKSNTYGGLSTSKSERIWYSPHCLQSHAPLFAMMGE